MWIFPAETPEILWRYTTGGRIITSPVMDENGTIYFGSEDRFLYALYDDGTLKWRLNLEDRITDTLTIAYDGTLYTGSRRGFLFAVNPQGKQVWKIKLKGRPFGNPAVMPDGNFYLATDEGWLYSISHTGFIRWEVKLPSYPVISPVIGTDIYIALGNERLYSYNITGGREWVFLLSGQAESLALSSDGIYIGTSNSTIVSIDFSGTRIWNTSLSGPVRSVSVLTSDRVICTSGNSVVMLDSFGNIIWEKNERSTQIDTAVLSDSIISLDVNGYLSWMDLNGSPVGGVRGGTPSGRLLTSTDGSVYVGSKDWLFYKYGFKDLISSEYMDYIWPSFRGGVENRGNIILKKKEIRKEELSGEPDYIYLMELAGSGNVEILAGLLDEIEYRLFSRTYDSGKCYLYDILELVASECVKRPLYEGALLVNDFPVIRSRAIEILGITGSFNTIKFITDLLVYEWDDFVMGSIIRSLGYLQSDIADIMTSAIVNYYESNINNLNSRSASQIIITVQKMNNYNGFINKELLAVITNIFLRSSSRSVKELALDTIQAIREQ
jgi:outer membrane protein assembly factor BamB